MAWPRVDGMRTLELGSPGEQRERLNALVLAGTKCATTGLWRNDYLDEDEELEALGEHLVMLDSSGARVGKVVVTSVDRTTFGAVPWTHAHAEGEDDADLAEWAAGHQRHWAGEGLTVEGGTEVVMMGVALVDPAPLPNDPWGLSNWWTHVHSGKVRDLYTDPTGRLLMVTSDRISAFDHVLSSPIPDKGAILTAMSTWWFGQLGDIVGNHLLPHDVPAAVRGRAVLTQRLDMVAVECVARGYLAGSGWKDYQNSGSVCGVGLPSGLLDGARLAEPIFTPATKAPLGSHDENVSFEIVASDIGADLAAELRALTLAVYSRGVELAARAGIILADTKVEFGREASGTPILADEVLTPDSSRYWPAETWKPGGAQPSFDKQFVRDWLTSAESGWDRGTDTPPPPLPDHVVDATRERYVAAYEQVTGLTFG